MKIIVASQSPIKLDAVKNALSILNIEAEVIGVKAQSNVAEQPINDETLKGAKNRIYFAQQLDVDADLYIAIENGIYVASNGHFIDKAIVLAIAKDGTENIVLSRGVEFPKVYVEEAIKRGLTTTTVGQVMAEQGVISNPYDPHLSLAGKSRVDILTDAIVDLFENYVDILVARNNASDYTNN